MGMKKRSNHNVSTFPKHLLQAAALKSRKLKPKIPKDSNSENESDSELKVKKEPKRNVEESSKSSSEEEQSQFSPKFTSSQIVKKESLLNNRFEVEENGENSRSEASSSDESEKTIVEKKFVKLNEKSCDASYSSFLKNNPNLVKLNINDDFLDEKHTEIHLLRIPKDFNIDLLLNQKFSLQNKTKFKLNKEKYVLKPEKTVEKPTLLAKSLKKVDLKSIYRLEKNVKVKSKFSVSVPERLNIPLPDNLKVRHPLFGDKFESDIKLDDRIVQKLKESPVKKKSNKKIKTKKIKKEKVEEDEIIFKLLENSFGNAESKRTKPKKRKNSPIIDTGKKKRKKTSL